MRILVVLAALVAVAFGNDSYVVVSPSKIRPGIPCTVSVNILKASGDVTVTAAITSQKSTLASASGTFQQGKPGQLVIQIPHEALTSSYELTVSGTGGLTFSNKSSLSFESKQMSIFIQTDKAVYKPGDTVNFRVLTVYPDLKPYTGPLDIYISDASSNKIRQFIGEVGIDGVITKSLSLSDQPVLGDWKISANAKNQAQTKVFTIDEYVLPKFEVDVIMPSYVVSTDTDVSFTIKAKYTYGKPVKGKLDVAVKMHYSYQDYDTSRDLPIFTTSLTIDGEAKVNFPMSAALQISKYLNNRKFSVRANVTESLTGNTLTGTGSVTVYTTGSKLEFPSSNPNTFKPGLKYTAYLKVSQQDGVPVASSKTQVTISTRVTSLKDPLATRPPNQFWWSPQTTTTNLPDQSLSVPVNGLVLIPIDIPADAKEIYMTAKYDQAQASKSISKSYSPSASYMQLSLGGGARIAAGGTFNVGVKATQPLGQMVYQILSRGQIVQVGSIDGQGQKTASFGVTTTSDMAPNARIVVYFVRVDGEIVTDSISFDVEGIFKNKVSISINQTEAEPGEPVKVTVRADPNSHAHLLAVDQSVLLLKSGNDITQDDVYTELKTYDTISTTHHDHFGPFFGGGGAGPQPRRAKRMAWWPYPIYYGGSDATAIFRNAGVVVLTDALVFQHYEPPIYVPSTPAYRPQPSASSSGGGAASGPGVKEVTRVRKDFPEAWIWTSSVVGSDGKADLMTSVPDTITSWVATAFAVNSNSGLGVAPTAAKFKVFRPFFVSLNLPYSVVRGEQVTLQAIVFNYMTTDQQATVTLGQSGSFLNINIDQYGHEVTSSGNAVQTVMVKAGEAKSVFFPIVPTDLGKIDLNIKAQSTQAADALRRQLLVEAEGVAKEYNIPTLIEIQNGHFTKTVDLNLPPNTVVGSELAKVSVIGDLMGPSISGIDNLLRMPTGCGEQTMLGLAPDVYVTDYLTSTNQLMGDIKAKALGYMEKGYQRELTYKHSDGSFSAFGDQDKSGSMWLTAFVCKVFHQAKPYIYVDDTVLKVAIDWMIRHQNANGSFAEPGRVIHKNMQGNAASGPSLTAFVLVSLLENQDLYTDGSATSTRFHNAKTKALQYLESETAKSSNLYLLAMSSYAFQLAGSQQTDGLLTRLKQMGNNDGEDAGLSQSTIRWFYNAKTKALQYLESETAKSSNLYLLAMSSYAFQLAGSQQTDGLLTRLKQMGNNNGGMFHLHQPETKKATTGSWHSPNPTSAIDTEMTSYVLMTYALRQDVAFGRKIMQWITQQRNANGGFSSTQDTVVALNALSSMAKQLYSNSFNLNVDVTMGTSPTYNFHIDNTNSVIMQRRETSIIPAKVKIDASGSGSALVEVAVFFNVESEIEDTNFDLQVKLVEETMNRLKIETCTRWMGTGEATGMVVQEIGIPSGFTADMESFPKMDVLKRKESQDKKVVLYFDEIVSTPTCLTFGADRTGLVSKSQPAAIRVYDYYQPSNQVTGFYQSQLLKNANVCDVCPDCENCVPRRG